MHFVQSLNSALIEYGYNIDDMYISMPNYDGYSIFTLGSSTIKVIYRIGLYALLDAQVDYILYDSASNDEIIEISTMPIPSPIPDHSLDYTQLDSTELDEFLDGFKILHDT